MTTPTTEIDAITLTTLRAMQAKLAEAAAIARAAEGCAADGQPARMLMIALDVEPLAVDGRGQAVSYLRTEDLDQDIGHPAEEPAVHRQRSIEHR
jgi:hypothetical protein